MAPTSTRTPGAATRVLVVCLWVAVATVAGPVPAAQAWSEGPCPDGDGVTVVVDFRSLGGDTIVRCAPAPVESGYDALTGVGLDWTPTQRHPGFLCRIEGVPADDPCVNTPPADAYWSYWRAEPGGSWAYSNYGPASTNPPPGPVDGWSFSTGNEVQPPRTAPPGSPAPAPSSPSPSPTAEPEPEPEPATTSAPPPPPPAPEPTSPDPAPTSNAGPPEPDPSPSDHDPSTPEPTGSPSAAGSPGASSSSSPSPTPTPTPTPTATPTPTPSASTTDRVATAATATDDGGPPLGTLAGVVLVLGVAGGAVVAGRRRRRP